MICKKLVGLYHSLTTRVQVTSSLNALTLAIALPLLALSVVSQTSTIGYVQ